MQTMMNAKEAAEALTRGFESHRSPLTVSHHVLSLPTGLLDVFSVDSKVQMPNMNFGGSAEPDRMEMWAVSLALSALGHPPGLGKRVILPPNVSLGFLGGELIANVGPSKSGVFPSLSILRSIQETLRTELPGVKVVVRMDAVILG